MSTNQTIPTRIDKRFLKELDDIKIKRLISGKDKPRNPTKTSRITLAVTRHKLFPQIKQDIIQADLP